MVSDIAPILADRGSNLRWKPWWCGFPARIGAGATTAIVGALASLGYHLLDQTVGNILRPHDITPAPTRSRGTTWKEFIRSHMDVLAESDFFTAEVLRSSGVVTYYVLFYVELESRRVWIGGITRHPESCWDAAGCPQRDARGRRLSERVPLRAARSRREALHGL